MRKLIATIVLSLAMMGSAFATTQSTIGREDYPVVFIEAGNSFAVAIAAGIAKKQVPVNVTTDRTKATMILHSSDLALAQDTDKTGTKVAKIIFGVPTILPASASVQLLDLGGKVLWAYSCSKGTYGKNNQRNTQSLAEAIAKHLKKHLEGKE